MCDTVERKNVVVIKNGYGEYRDVLVEVDTTEDVGSSMQNNFGKSSNYDDRSWGSVENQTGKMGTTQNGGMSDVTTIMQTMSQMCVTMNKMMETSRKRILQHNHLW
ncbi:hypothetical protein FQR65_LT15713 [Abscondita terminalis]|nr:hypothetical protein FQR65_LT15713 [Abscondita terminalis]